MHRLHCCGKCSSSWTNECHLIWAMFFDTELKNRFYAEGGWGNLRRMAQPYILCHKFLTEHHDKYSAKRGTTFFSWPVKRTIAASEEFNTFLNRAFTIGLNVTLSTKWVNNCLLNNNKPFPQTSVLPVCGEVSPTFAGLENLLQYMKYMCDPLSSKLTEYDGKTAKGRIPPRLFYEAKTGNTFTVDEGHLNVSGKQLAYPNDSNYEFRSPIQEQKRMSSGNDGAAVLKTIVGSSSPSKKKNPKMHRSPVGVFENDLQTELGSVLSKLDINVTSPEKIVSPNHVRTILSPGGEVKPARKRRSGRKENSPSQIALSSNLLREVSPAKERISPRGKMNTSAEKREVKCTTDERTRSIMTT